MNDDIPTSPRGFPMYGVALGQEVEDIIDHPSVNELLDSIKSGIANQLRQAAMNGYQMAKDPQFSELAAFSEYIDGLPDDKLLDAFSEDIVYKEK